MNEELSQTNEDRPISGQPMDRRKGLSVIMRLIMLLLAVALTIIVYLMILALVQRHQQNELYQSRLESRDSMFTTYVDSSTARLKPFAVDYTYWDDMVTFVRGGGKDVTFAKNNIDTGLGTFGASAVWIYSSDYKLIYSAQDEELEQTHPGGYDSPFSVSAIRKVFKKNGVYHFYLRTDDALFEVEAATIHPTTDAERETPTQGYFYAAKMIGRQYLGEAGKAIEGTVELLSASPNGNSNSQSYNADTGEIQILRPIYDYNTNYVGSFKLSYLASDLIQFQRTQTELAVFGIVLLSIVCLCLYFSLQRWVISPLNRVRQSLSSNSEDNLASLKIKRDEFGDISRLIIEFFDQQKELSEKKANVEEMVLKRTHELSHEHARLMASINSLDAGFLITYGQSHVAMCNPALAKMLGIESSEKLDPDGTIAVTLSQFENSLGRHDIVSKISECLKTGQSFKEVGVKSGDTYLDLLGSPIKIYGTEIIGCVIVVNKSSGPVSESQPSTDS